MEYRGYVHKERRPHGVWVALFCQVDGDERTVLEASARPRQRDAYIWVYDRTRDAYDSISLVPSKKSVDAVKLPFHCLWCGKLLRFRTDLRKAAPYCTGHRAKARKARASNPHKGDECWNPGKAAYLHRGTAIMTARLLDLDCYLCVRGDRGCNAYHLTSAPAILDELRKSQEGNAR